jgi:mRNA interferase MazF
VDKRRRAIAFPRRGDVYLVDFDPTVGAGIRKTRPAVVIQNDIANRHSSITIVAALTSKHDERLYPTEVLVRPPDGGTSAESVVLLNQIRSVDKRRLLRRLGPLRTATMAKIDLALALSLGLAGI